LTGSRRDSEDGNACNSPPDRWLDAPHFPQGFDFFRVEWERAAWQRAGDRVGEMRAKTSLLRWRLHHLLAELTQELAHYYEAVLARPDLPTTQAALGCALARDGQPALAVPHLRLAVRMNPFDLAAARALFQALGDSGDHLGQEEFVRERRLLAKAAPRMVPREEWFAEWADSDGFLQVSANSEPNGPLSVGEVKKAGQAPAGTSPVEGCDSKGRSQSRFFHQSRSPFPPTGSVEIGEVKKAGQAPAGTSPVEGCDSEGRSQSRFFHQGRSRSAGFNIVWEGDHEEVHSLGLVNRALCRQLLLRGHKLAALPSGHNDSPADVDAKARQLEAFFLKSPPGSADVYVRHQWPPRFTPPPCGRWVIMQPWEFGSLPKAWIEPMSHSVDEIWVASHWVRRCYFESGIPGDRVHVIRQGVDPAIFHPNNPPLPLQTRKRFKFLFVGGSIHRKGIDILLNAYARTFTRADDVCLVIKDMGVGTFYQGMVPGVLTAI
jgi:hypothetical protein